jgi:hypothetical protein
MTMRIPVALVAGALTLGLVAPNAAAADFTPTIKFSLSESTVGANPELLVDVAQDMGEEELDLVEITIPAGFTLATDEQIPNGTNIGSGTINIHVGPRCRGTGPLSAPATTNVRIFEQDRTPTEVADGVVAIFVVDILGVTRITLKVKGSSATGYTLSGNVPPNQDTCPPFSFAARFFKQAAGKPVLLNPSSGGTYTFRARFVGLNGSVSESQQAITIAGSAGRCKGRAATLVGTDADDTLTGTKGKDVVLAMGGNDTIRTKGGNDRICADKGNDKVAAGAGDDLLLGQGGNDALNGGPGDDRCVGGAGRDRARACEVSRP